MDDLKAAGSGLREIALFAGAGGGILGGKLLGWRTVCAVEKDPYAAGILAARQDDGHLPTFPIWDDVCTFDGLPWRGRCDVVSGGFPCQDISTAGRGAGIDGERSGLWREMARIIREVEPRYAFVENVPALCSRGLGRVLGDLAEMGYDARWCVLGAVDAGAPHRRERIWILADAQRGRVPVRRGTAIVGEGDRLGRGVCGDESQSGKQQAGEVLADTEVERRQGTISTGNPCTRGCVAEHGSWRWESNWFDSEPDVGRVAHGVAHRVDRLRCIGNGQVPAVAALAWRLLGGE